MRDDKGMMYQISDVGVLKNPRQGDGQIVVTLFVFECLFFFIFVFK